MIDLPDVTLCAVDCVNPILALRALDICMCQCRFGDALFFSDSAGQYQLPGCRMIDIPRLSSRADYSRFVIKELAGHVATSHLLLVQWDGYVINGAAWRDEFLTVDYIGAPWRFHNDAHRVGNGGFSLRSKRLLDALRDPRIVDLDPEDDAICRRYRPLLEQSHGIRFASVELARKFAFETMEPDGKPYGFHGLFNMWMVLPPEQWPDFVATLAPASVAGIPMLRLGENLVELRRWREARLVVERRLHVTPADPAAQALLARIDAGEGATGAAGDPQRHLQTAMQWHQAGRLDEAAAAYRQVLALDPAQPVAKQYLGVIAMQRGAPAEGERLIREAIAALPDIADFHNNLGLCLRLQDKLEEAVAAYRQALVLHADYLPAYNNLGLDLLGLGRPGDASPCFERALALAPDFAEAHWNLGLALLTQGEFERGWREYEWRGQCSSFVAEAGKRPASGAPWRGEPLTGKTLLLRAEQGAGDTVQFLRFIPELHRRGARLWLEVGAELAELALGIDPRLTWADPAGEPVATDYWVDLMSLPRWLNPPPAALGAAVPYLTPSEPRLAAWRQRLEGYPERRIGLVWAGNPRNRNDRKRSCPLATLRPWFTLPGIRWFSLQKGEAAGQLTAEDRRHVVDLAPELHSYADTAAALAALDLLISVDTSVVHLAGALGRPAWVMIPFAPDWRWLLEREDSPWYPSLRLFRQRAGEGWPEVRDRIGRALAVDPAPSR